MKVKFCCEKFEFRQSLPSEKGLNIRIVKYEPNQLLDKDNLYRFYIATYFLKGEKCDMNLNIAFCPFCGTNLFKFYKSDDYINEDANCLGT